MGQVTSRGFHKQLILNAWALLLLASLLAYGQSLGDVARENRENKAAQAPSTPPKVITNANLPKDPDGYTAPTPDESQTPVHPHADAATSRKAAQLTAAQQRVAAQWKQRIQTQKYIVASQQARIDNFKATMPLANASVGSGIPYTRYQAHLEQMQIQLEQQQRKLEDMQESARHAGAEATVFDP